MQRGTRLYFIIGILLLGLHTGALLAAGPPVAILVSDNTKLYFDLHYPECGEMYAGAPNTYVIGMNEYKRYYMGWEWVLSNEFGGSPVQYQEITDVSPAILKPFALLILSNAVNLTDAQQDVIVNWVKRDGGKLIATYGSGYKDLTTDIHQDDNLKLQKGGTGGLHQLWQDPVSKLFSSADVDLDGVDVRLSRSAGPTQGLPVGSVVKYEPWTANMLVKRPESSRDVYAFLVIENPDWTRSQPAILYETPVKGQVVYYAFAPEYHVALRHMQGGACSTDIRFPPLWPTAFYENYYAYLENEPALFNGEFMNQTAGLVNVMKATIKFLLGL